MGFDGDTVTVDPSSAVAAPPVALTIRGTGLSGVTQRPRSSQAMHGSAMPSPTLGITNRAWRRTRATSDRRAKASHLGIATGEPFLLGACSKLAAVADWASPTAYANGKIHSRAPVVGVLMCLMTTRLPIDMRCRRRPRVPARNKHVIAEPTYAGCLLRRNT